MFLKEELLKELREVAKYWKTHKDELKKEIGSWVEKKPFKFIKKKKEKPKTTKKKHKKKKKKSK